MKSFFLIALLTLTSPQSAVFSANSAPARTDALSEEEEPDSKLEKAVRKQFKADALLANLEITISAKSGVVRLTGEVESAEQKQRAKETATGVTGVKRVVNKLTIAK